MVNAQPKSREHDANIGDKLYVRSFCSSQARAYFQLKTMKVPNMLWKPLKILGCDGFFVEFTVKSNVEGNGYKSLQEQSPIYTSFALNLETENCYLKSPTTHTSLYLPLG